MADGYQPQGASRYGSSYFQIKTPQETIYLMADELKVNADGTLLCIGHFRSRERTGESAIYAAFAPGQWVRFFAASTIDGSAVSVEHLDAEE